MEVYLIYRQTVLFLTGSRVTVKTYVPIVGVVPLDLLLDFLGAGSDAGTTGVFGARCVAFHFLTASAYTG